MTIKCNFCPKTIEAPLWRAQGSPRDVLRNGRGARCAETGGWLKPKREGKREKPEGGQPQLPGVRNDAPAGTTQVLPMQLKVGDRLSDETGEYEVIGRPYTTAGGKNAHVRVKRVDSDVTMIRTYGAHERVSV
jgi:hypothetical protein